MGLRIIEGTKINEGDDRIGAVFYCSVDGMAFGPVMDDAEKAEEFLQWCLANHDDPRKIPVQDLKLLWRTWGDGRGK